MTNWSPNFDPLKEKIKETPIWVELHNLPHEYWDQETLRLIGDKLGTYVKSKKVLDNKDYSIYPRILILWQECHPLPEIVELRMGEGLWKQSIVIDRSDEINCEIDKSDLQGEKVKDGKVKGLESNLLTEEIDRFTEGKNGEGSLNLQEWANLLINKQVNDWSYLERQQG